MKKVVSCLGLPETATTTKVRAATTARAMFGILGRRKPQSSSQTNLSVGARESESVLTGFTALSNWSKTNALSSKMSSRFSVQKPLFRLWRFCGIAFNLVLAATWGWSCDIQQILKTPTCYNPVLLSVVVSVGNGAPFAALFVVSSSSPS